MMASFQINESFENEEMKSTAQSINEKIISGFSNSEKNEANSRVAAENFDIEPKVTENENDNNCITLNTMNKMKNIDVEVASEKSDINGKGNKDNKSLDLPTDTKKEKSLVSQYSYQIELIACLSLTYIASGGIIAFPSVIIADVEENNSTIYGDYLSFTDTQLDLMGSAMNFGSIIAVPIAGFTMGRYGRKPTLQILALIGIVSWIGIALSPTATSCLIFRVIAGMSHGGGGAARVAYVVEITDNVTRPIITQFVVGIITIGQVISIIPSFWLHYYGTAFVNALFPVAFFIATVLVLPESPTYLTIKGKEEKAAQLVKKLRREGTDVQKVLDTYKEMNKAAQQVNKMKAVCNRNVLKKLVLVLTLFSLNVCTGYQMYSSQTARFLIDSGSTTDETLSTFLCLGAQLTGVLAVIPFVNRLGRRGCLMLSLVVNFLGTSALGTYALFYDRSLQLETNSNASQTTEDVFFETRLQERTLYDIEEMSMYPYGNYTTSIPDGDDSTFVSRNGWIPLATFMLAQFGMGLGGKNVPFVLATEYFPTAIRPVTSTIGIGYVYLAGFLYQQLYTPMKEAFTMAGLLYFYSFVCIIEIPFVKFLVVETVGKNVG